MPGVITRMTSRRLLYGEPWWRQPLLVFLRVALTLLLEGIVFFLFGYRQKRSWILFFLANGLTQLFVNLLLLNFVGALGNLYSAKLAFWFLYLPMEILVILLELFLFCPMLKEKKRWNAVLYTIAANLCSWLLGGALLAYLPI